MAAPACGGAGGDTEADTAGDAATDPDGAGLTGDPGEEPEDPAAGLTGACPVPHPARIAIVQIAAGSRNRLRQDFSTPERIVLTPLQDEVRHRSANAAGERRRHWPASRRHPWSSLPFPQLALAGER